MGWGEIAGALINYESNSRDARRKSELNDRQKDAQGQSDAWSMADERALQERLHSLALQRYESQNNLAQRLASGDRTAAGDAARLRGTNQLQAALGRTAPATAIDRSLTGNTTGYGNWGANVAAGYAPVQQARMALLTNSRAQRGMARYDTLAMNDAADQSIDISRQASDAQARSAYLDQARRRILAQAGIANTDNGPGNGYYNAQLAASLARAGGAYADSYGGSGGNGMTASGGRLSYTSPAGPAR